MARLENPMGKTEISRDIQKEEIELVLCLCDWYCTHILAIILSRSLHTSFEHNIMNKYIVARGNISRLGVQCKAKTKVPLVLLLSFY